MNMKRSIIICLGIMVSFGLWAQKTWEGTAAAGRYGEFPPSGYFGASNSFPRNSIVDVQNLGTGKSVRLIITGGLSDPSLFLIISEQAATDLGLPRNDAVRVRVSPVVIPGAGPAVSNQDLPYSVDPDVNPAARVGDANLAVNPRTAPAAPPAASAEVPKASLSLDRKIPADTPPVPAPTREPAVSASTLSEKPAAPAVQPAAGLADAPAVEPQVSASIAQAPAPAVSPAVTTAIPVPAPAAAPAPDDGWAKPSPVNRIDEMQSMVTGRSKELFPPPREDEVYTMVTAPQAPAARIDVSPEKIAVAAPEREETPKVESLGSDASYPALPDFKIVSAEVFLEPDIIVLGPHKDPPLFFNGIELIGPASVPAAAAESAPVDPSKSALSPGRIVLALEPADMKPPVYDSPDISFSDLQPKAESDGSFPAHKPAVASTGGAEAPRAAAAEEPIFKTDEEEKVYIEKLDTIISSIPPVEKAVTPVPAPKAEVPAVVAGDEWAAKNLPLAASLRKNAYYLQIGSYSNPRSAKPIIDALSPAYPVVVVSSPGEKALYRVFVGPVNEDEKGLLLYQVRAKGYKDAFVQRSE
jgi:hypothetical protein